MTAEPNVVRFAARLPMPPSANRYWRSNRGAVHLSDEAKAYKAAVALLVPARPIAGGHVLALRFVGLRANADLGNRLKVLEDVLNMRAYLDDQEAIAIHLYRGEPCGRKVVAGVEVEVTGPRYATGAEVAAQRQKLADAAKARKKGRATRRRNQRAKSRPLPSRRPTPNVYRPGRTG